MTDTVTTFCEAVWRGEAKTIARLAPHIDPDGEDKWHHKPLAMAAQYGDVALVRLLLDRGAAVDAGRTYLTPITYAARRGARDIVELCDGKRTLPEIVEELQRRYPSEDAVRIETEAVTLLSRLRARGVLEQV